MKGAIPMLGLWDTRDEAAIFSAINHYLETNITYKDIEQHFDTINNKDVKEWKVGDSCWRIVTRSLTQDDCSVVHEYNVSMYLLNWSNRPYVYDYNLTNEMASDKLHFLVRVDTDDNTWDVEEIADPTSGYDIFSHTFY